MFPARLAAAVLVAAVCVATTLGMDKPPDPPSDLARLKREADQAVRQGNRTTAIAAMEKLIAAERAELGEAHPDLIASLERLARLHLEVEDFAAAGKARREARRA